MDELIVNDGPEDRCFGCGHRNEHGLRMRFRRTGEGSVEAAYTVPAHFGGFSGVVHGGIQATLLDEVCGMSIHVAETDEVNVVTADFRLRFRRPVPVETPLVVRGHLERTEPPSYFTTGEILGPDGEVLTTAEARWRRLDG
jgi:uncharacterized protein (TIGR00369 family)